MLVEFLGRGLALYLSDKLLQEPLLRLKVYVVSFLFHHGAERCQVYLLTHPLIELLNTNLRANSSTHQALYLTDFLEQFLSKFKRLLLTVPRLFIECLLQLTHIDFCIEPIDHEALDLNDFPLIGLLDL